jgi:post-segregation antitoxin (ccd killing protein)
MADRVGHSYMPSMTTVQITLPDDLVEKANRSGLLASERLEATLREQLRAEAVGALREMWDRASDDGTPQLTDEEVRELVQVEIDAVRAEKRRATGH